MMTDYRKYSEGEQLRLAFLLQDATLWPAWESFYYSAINDSRFQVKIFLSEKVEFTYQTLNSAKEFLENKGISYTMFSERELLAFEPHAALLQTPYDYMGRKPEAYSYRLKSMGIRVVYIPYGIEIVDTPSARHDHFRTPVIQNAYRIYVMSDDFAIEYKKYCLNYHAVRALGLPRFDRLLKKNEFPLPDEITNRINGRPLVTWHTHFAKVSCIDGANRQITPYLEEYMEFAEAISHESEFFFIFLPHPKFGNDLSDPFSNQKSAEVLKRLDSLENVFVDRSADYRSSLLNADAVITDRSSLMIEAAIYNPPILYLQNPDYQELIFKPLKPLTDSYYQGTGCSDMQSFLETLKNGTDERHLLREQGLKRAVPCLDGKCGHRIKEDLYNSLAEESSGKAGRHQKESQNIIIFGTGFMYNTIMGYYKFPEYCNIIALTDNACNKWGTLVDGIEVISPKQIQETDFDKIIIMVNSLPAEHIYKQLRFDLEIPDNKIEYCEYLATL